MVAKKITSNCDAVLLGLLKIFHKVMFMDES